MSPVIKIIVEGKCFNIRYNENVQNIMLLFSIKYI